MASTVSSSDLEAFANQLKSDARLVDRIATLIRDLARVVELNGESKKSRRSGPSPALLPRDVVEDALQQFASKGVHKAEAMEILRAAAAPTKWVGNPNAPLRDNFINLLKRFGTVEQRRELLARIGQRLGTNEDPFLRGMS